MAFLAIILWANRRAVFQIDIPYPTTTAWMVFTYVTVAVLPIVWVFSLTPLLPVIVYLLIKWKLSTLFISVCCIGLPFFIPIWGPNSVLPLVLVTVLVGVGLIFDALPFRFFMAKSWRRVVAAQR